jgi:hypothetical protein
MTAAADLYLVISAIRHKGKTYPYYDSAEFRNGIEEAARLAEQLADMCRFSEESEIFRGLREARDNAAKLAAAANGLAYADGFYAGAKWLLDGYAEIRYPAKKALRRIRRHCLWTLPRVPRYVRLMPLTFFHYLDVKE